MTKHKILKTAPLPTKSQSDKFRRIASRAFIQGLKDDLTVFFHVSESDLLEQTGLPVVKLDKKHSGVNLAGQKVEVYDDFFTLNGLQIDYLATVGFLSGREGFVSVYVDSDEEPASVLVGGDQSISDNVLRFPTHRTLQ